MSTAPIAGTPLSFEATLEDWAEGMDYCAVRVPAEITEALGTREAVLVRAHLNDSAPFDVSLFPVGNGVHYIRIRAKIRKATGTASGDRVRMHVTVLDRAAVGCPDDLLSVLEAEDAVGAFEALAPGRRHYLIRRIDDAVKPETRAKRIADALREAREAAAKAAAR
jgi:hypothetical protein